MARHCVYSLVKVARAGLDTRRAAGRGERADVESHIEKRALFRTPTPAWRGDGERIGQSHAERVFHDDSPRAAHRGEPDDFRDKHARSPTRRELHARDGLDG
jgi:hypothetical protein